MKSGGTLPVPAAPGPTGRDSNMEMLQLNDLHKTFNPGTVNEKVALAGV